jgi:hypothetical protein
MSLALFLFPPGLVSMQDLRLGLVVFGEYPPFFFIIFPFYPPYYTGSLHFCVNSDFLPCFCNLGICTDALSMDTEHSGPLYVASSVALASPQTFCVHQLTRPSVARSPVTAPLHIPGLVGWPIGWSPMPGLLVDSSSGQPPLILSRVRWLTHHRPRRGPHTVQGSLVDKSSTTPSYYPGFVG